MLFGRPKRTLTRLLIVEDEPLVAFDNERFLTDEDFTIVATVDRVADATALLGDGVAIDLVLVDVSLSDGSGIDVARAAAAQGIAVMFVTGQDPDGGDDVAHGCLSKPYSQRTLLRAIEAVDRAVQGDVPRKLPAGFRLLARAQTPAA
ncbi:MAG: response regulator [Pseudomonadota bacterium]